MAAKFGDRDDRRLYYGEWPPDEAEAVDPATVEQQVRTKVVTGPDRPTHTTSRIAETK